MSGTRYLASMGSLSIEIFNIGSVEKDLEMLRAKTVPRLEDCVDMIVFYCRSGRMKSIKVAVFELNWKGSFVNFEDKLHKVLQYKLKVIIIYAESVDHANDKHKFQISVSSLGNKFPAAILMFAWNFNACYLEELFDLANVAMQLFYSLVLVTPWDPRKCNFLMVGAAYGLGGINYSAKYYFMKLVYDKGKFWSSSIWMRLNLVYDRGKFWSSSIWVQLISSITVINGSIPICFSGKLKALPVAKMAIETISNLEDKVVFLAVGDDRKLDMGLRPIERVRRYSLNKS
jgi:hypothetical protein